MDGSAGFNLCGGTICGCKGYGGAVNISRQGRMEFSAGLIEGCESLSCGGAILLEGSRPHLLWRRWHRGADHSRP